MPARRASLEEAAGRSEKACDRRADQCPNRRGFISPGGSVSCVSQSLELWLLPQSFAAGDARGPPIALGTGLNARADLAGSIWVMPSLSLVFMTR